MIKQLMKYRKISRKQLAEMLDVSEVAVSNWCSGNYFPTKEKLDKLCEIFDCTYYELFVDVSGLRMALSLRLQHLSDKQIKEVIEYIDEIQQAEIIRQRREWQENS